MNNLFFVTTKNHMSDLVIAKTREQARYLMWKQLKNFTGKIKDIPNFRVKLLKKDVWKNRKGIVSSMKKFIEYWNWF